MHREAPIVFWTKVDYHPHPSREVQNPRDLMSTTAMTVQDVAAYLSIDLKTVCRMVKRGDLPGVKVGGSWRFRRKDIDE